MSLLSRQQDPLVTALTIILSSEQGEFIRKVLLAKNSNNYNGNDNNSTNARRKWQQPPELKSLSVPKNGEPETRR